MYSILCFYSSYLPRSTSSSKPSSDDNATASSSLGSNLKSTSNDNSATTTCNVPESSSSSENIDASTSASTEKLDRTSPPITITYLDEEKIYELIEYCKNEKFHPRMVRTIGEVFSSFELLSQSFVRQPSSTIEEMLKKAPKDLKSIKKEDLRILEGDLDKDEDSTANKDDDEQIEPKSSSNDTTVDLSGLRKAMQKLFELDYIYEALNNGLHSLSIVLSVDLRLDTQKERIEKSLHIFVIVFEIMAMGKFRNYKTKRRNFCKIKINITSLIL